MVAAATGLPARLATRIPTADAVRYECAEGAGVPILIESSSRSGIEKPGRRAALSIAAMEITIHTTVERLRRAEVVLNG